MVLLGPVAVERDGAAPPRTAGGGAPEDEDPDPKVFRGREAADAVMRAEDMRADDVLGLERTRIIIRKDVVARLFFPMLRSASSSPQIGARSEETMKRLSWPYPNTRVLACAARSAVRRSGAVVRGSGAARRSGAVAAACEG